MEDLVNHIFEEFRQDFFPGEQVTVVMDDGERFDGVVREKASFSEQRRPDGEVVRQAFSRYFVKLNDRPMEEALMDNEHVVRSRKVFSKHMLRILLKNSLTREPWAGAPWVLKEKIAIEYKIPTEIPPHLQQENRQAERKANLAMRREEQEGTFFQFYANQQQQQRLPELKPAKGHRGKLSHQEMQRQKQIQLQQYQDAIATGQFQGFPGVPLPYPHQPIPYVDNFHQLPIVQQIASRQPQMPPPPPPPKGPLDDLDVAPKRSATTRPQLKFWVKPKNAQRDSDIKTIFEDSGLAMRSIGPLLETWNTLNVLCEPFLLDSFNLDDFVDAMSLPSDVGECELLDELHCAVLSLLVDESGQVKVSLPEFQEDSEEEDEDSEADDSAESTTLPDAPARSTRSSLAKQEAAALAEEKARDSPASKSPKHRAAEMLTDQGWVERAAAREFDEGGWQTILVGIIHQLSLQPSLKEDCEVILAHLAPMDEQATAETAQKQYATLDVNLRVAILQMITILAPSTQAVRDYLEECSEEMTQMRKDKIEQQRKKKPLIEELTSLDQKRKILLPSNMPDSDTEDTKLEPTDVDLQAPGATDQEELNGVDDSSDEEPPTRSLRRNSGRALDRKRKREEDLARKEKEKKDKETAKTSKQSAEFKKVLRDIEKKKTEIKECEDAIADLDNDLREANCQRTRPLGRDRFWNRYWWFERNGMPFAGMPDSSTSACGYANGRIWVQGPAPEEREGFLELPKGEAATYEAAHGVSLVEREERDCGVGSQLWDAGEWGYYDDPEALDALIGWLDERGKRERELRKELQSWRDQIATQMGAMKAHLEEREKRRLEAEEEAETGVVTRHGRRDVEKDLDLKRHPCLEWHNGSAIRELGRRHAVSANGGKRKKAKKKGVAEVVGSKKKKALEVEQEPVKTKKVETRSTRSGKR
ncbi:MAG: hypothetical protein Q9157_000672 [Trypethelium eluteriae]